MKLKKALNYHHQMDEILILEPEDGRELLKKIIADLEKQEREDFINELEGICLNE